MTETSSGAALLQFEVVNQVATLTLNSPSKRNAMEPAMRDELAAISAPFATTTRSAL